MHQAIGRLARGTAVIGGFVLIAKSLQQLDGEILAGRRASELLGGDEPAVELIEVLGRKTALVKVTKSRPTGKGFPRRPGLPRHSPLGS